HPDRGRKILAPMSIHRRLGVEKVHLRRGARLEQVNDPLRLRGEVRQARQDLGLRLLLIGQGLTAEQSPQSRQTQPGPGLAEEDSTVERILDRSNLAVVHRSSPVSIYSAW